MTAVILRCELLRASKDDMFWYVAHPSRRRASARLLRMTVRVKVVMRGLDPRIHPSS
jgi:hypothetical protein